MVVSHLQNLSHHYLSHCSLKNTTISVIHHPPTPPDCLGFVHLMLRRSVARWRLWHWRGRRQSAACIGAVSGYLLKPPSYIRAASPRVASPLEEGETRGRLPLSMVRRAPSHARQYHARTFKEEFKAPLLPFRCHAAATSFMSDA